MRIRFSPEEKATIQSIIRTWKPEQMTQQTFDEIRRDHGVPRGLVQSMFWHVDTLSALEGLDWLVFRGGTCVQSHLPHGRQRASDDLDFNSAIANPRAIEKEIEAWNGKALGNGRAVIVRDIAFGTLEPFYHDRPSGTLTFRRRMPSKFADMETVNGTEVLAKAMKVQMNYKHADLASVIRRKARRVDFFIMSRQGPKKTVRAVHSTPDELIADKVLAASRANPSHREKFKDVYDLASLLSLTRHDRGKVNARLDIMGEAMGLDAATLVRGAMQTVSDMGEDPNAASAHISMVCRDGRRELEDWEMFCIRTVKALGGLFGD